MGNIMLGLVLFVGAGTMIIPLIVQSKWYSVARWKSIIISIVLVLTGVWGSKIWYFVENLSFGGRSFFGAIFFAPIMFWPIAKVLKIPYTIILDFIPPAGCLTLALVKLQCLYDHCCQGRVLYIDENYLYVRFPSQIVEMVNFLILAAVLLILSYIKKARGKIFPLFLVLYGITRFVLNTFRGELTPYLFGLSAGHFWSVVSIFIGISWLILNYVWKPKKAIEKR